MRLGVAFAFGTVACLVTAAFASHFATPPLYTDGSAVTCTFVNLHANREPVRMWIEVDGYDQMSHMPFCPAPPTPPITTTTPDSDPYRNPPGFYPPNACFFWCGRLDRGQSCTAVIYPPAGHAVTCAVTAPGVSYDENQVQVTLYVGNVFTTLRGEG
jgi:hypothetical protein